MRLRKLLKSGLFLLFVAPLIAAQESLPDLVSRIKPSVVALVTYDEKGHELARGSGFFTAPDRVVTNLHVIESASRVEIHQSDGTSVPVEGVLAVDGGADLVLIRVITKRRAQALSVAARLPREGESVVVVGNPLGLEGSVSNGIVSAVRDIPNFGHLIQITAAISPGSSGSPVVNLAGKVVGVATLQFARGQNINFAVPSERVVRLLPGSLIAFAELARTEQRSRRARAEKLYREGLALRFVSKNVCEKAMSFFEKASESDPSYADPWAQIGYCTWKSTAYLEGEAVKSGLEKALAAYQEAIRLKPHWDEAEYGLGTVYRDLAIWHYNRGIDDVDLEQTEHALALTNFEMSVKMFKEVIRTKESRPSNVKANIVALWGHSDLAEVWSSLADSLNDLERYQEAADAYQRALALNPSDHRTRYLLGRVFLRLGDRRSALEQYKILNRVETDTSKGYAEMLLEEIEKKESHY